MKYLLPLLFIMMLMLSLASCAGEDDPDEDKIPPVPPIMTPHLGDTGDPISVGPDDLSDDNNGIDTVPDGNWIRLSWSPFIDTDLSHVKIYRYDNINTEPVMIDSIISDSDEYLDSAQQLEERIIYSYFIDLVDTAGNYARSDTVSYGLLGKSIALEPENNSFVTPGNIRFKWNRSGFASKFRVIVWDENNHYVWHQDLVVSIEEDPLEIIFPVNLAQAHVGETLRWRIDSFDWDEDLQGEFGSESLEWVFHVQGATH